MIKKISILDGGKYFSSRIFQIYSVFIPYIKYFIGTTRIDSWKSNGRSEENIENIAKSGSSFASTFNNYHVLPVINFNGHYIINNNIYIPKRVINLYISYILNSWLRNLNTNFTLNNCLFWSEKVTKNADLDKYKYSGYGIGFYFRSIVQNFYLQMETWEKMSLFLELI